MRSQLPRFHADSESGGRLSFPSPDSGIARSLVERRLKLNGIEVSEILGLRLGPSGAANKSRGGMTRTLTATYKRRAKADEALHGRIRATVSIDVGRERARRLPAL